MGQPSLFDANLVSLIFNYCSPLTEDRASAAEERRPTDKTESEGSSEDVDESSEDLYEDEIYQDFYSESDESQSLSGSEQGNAERSVWLAA